MLCSLALAAKPWIDLVSMRGRVDVHAGAGLQRVGDDQADDQRQRGDQLEVDQRLEADAADLLMSSMLAMPCTTVQKMIGAMSILIILMNASPSGFICSPSCG